MKTVEDNPNSDGKQDPGSSEISMEEARVIMSNNVLRNYATAKNGNHKIQMLTSKIILGEINLSIAASLARIADVLEGKAAQGNRSPILTPR